ncbi:MAG: WD40 repeat domain-containing protein [bacterium]
MFNIQISHVKRIRYFRRLKKSFAPKNKNILSQHGVLVIAIAFALLIPFFPALESSLDSIKTSSYPDAYAKTVQLDKNSGTEIARGVIVKNLNVKQVLTHQYDVFSIAFSPDGSQLATGGILDGRVSIWDAHSGKLIRVISDQAGSVEVLTYSPDGKYLVAGRGFVKRIKGNTALNIWNAKTGQLVNNISEPRNVMTLKFSPDQKYLAVGFLKERNNFNDIYIYDAINWNQVKTLSTPGGFNKDFFYSHDGERFIYWMENSYSINKSEKENAINILDAKTGKQIRVIKGEPSQSAIKAIALSPDSKFIASADDKNIIRICNIDKGAFTKVQAGHYGFSNFLTYSPDSKYIVSVGNDKTIRVWRAMDDTAVALLKMDSFVHSAAFSPDGRYLAASVGKKVVIMEFRSF